MSLSVLLYFISATSLTFSPPDSDREVAISADPESIVIEFCNARVALDAARMHQFISDDYHTLPTDGTKKPYDRSLAFSICEWEKGMQTRWSFEILGTNGNVVTVLLKEQNKYFELLGLGQGVQVSQYTVLNGKIQRSESRLFITQKSSQNVEFGNFRNWLFGQPNLSEPDLIKPDGSFYFTGKSAPVMLKWLERYDDFRKK